MKLAAIDIGSNAMRLLVGEVYEQNGMITINKSSLVRLPVRLGTDVFETGIIGPEKADEFVKGIEAFNIIRKIHKVAGIRACATSAMRDAQNGRELAKEAYNKTGIEIEIIDGQVEADIILSTFHLLDLEKEVPYLYIDVGGGSTEISLLINGKAMSSQSFKIGTVRMLTGKVKPKTVVKMLEWVDRLKFEYHPQKAIGSGGNINKLVKLCCPLSENEMEIAALKAIYETMKDLTPEERMVEWGLRSDRADVIVPASEIYLGIIEHAGINTIIVPKIGLADGLLYNMYLDFKEDEFI
jgi:exopolyphosphatase/guanosine-5'-triphosphate,3'-diphosphate pyrophosphatase